MADSAAIVTLIVGLGAGTAYQVLDRDDAVDRVLLCLTVMGAVILMLGGTAITGTLASAWVLWVWTVGFIYGIVVAESVLRRRDRREHEVQAMVVKTARHGSPPALPPACAALPARALTSSRAPRQTGRATVCT